MDICGKKVDIFPSDAAGAPLVVLNTFEGEGARVRSACIGFGCPDFSLAAVSGLDWDADMTPWEFTPDRPGSGTYRGAADAWLDKLTGEVLPRVIETLGAQPSAVVIAGYSLAGLFAVYSAYRCGAFDAVVSASGSLWYPGFADHAAKNLISPRVRAVYFSLGDRERRTRDPVMRTVEEMTGAICDHVAESGIRTVFEKNPGNHFKDTELRTAKGIAWVLGQL